MASTHRIRRAARAAAVVGLAYAVGSVPFSNLAARPDAAPRPPRRRHRHGLGHLVVSSGRFRPGYAAAGVFEVAKGAFGPLLAGTARGIASLSGGAAVAGHNWSVFLAGAGGRGLSPPLGALLAQDPAGTAVLLGGMVVGRLAGKTADRESRGLPALVPVLAVRSVAGALPEPRSSSPSSSSGSRATPRHATARSTSPA